MLEQINLVGVIIDKLFKFNFLNYNFLQEE